MIIGGCIPVSCFSPFTKRSCGARTTTVRHGGGFALSAWLTCNVPFFRPPNPRSHFQQRLGLTGNELNHNFCQYIFTNHLLIVNCAFLRILLRELPDMMSAPEGGGGSWKSGCSKGGCANFVV